MKIFLTSASPEKKNQYERLIELWECSSKKHTLVQSPNDADLALISDIGGSNWFQALRENKNIINPQKCFVVADSDVPMPLLHGVYTSNHRHLKFRSRFRTGAYHLFPKEIHNPFVANSSGQAYLHSKKYFYSFVGQDSSALRLELFKKQSKRSDVLIVNSTSHFNAYNKKESHERQQEAYYETLLDSKFVLCPKGTSGASIRLFEVLQAGVAPVIISDDWVFPSGPSWEKFSVIIKEKNIDQLDAILEEREKEYEMMGREARKAYELFFADKIYFDYLIDQLLSIQASQKIPEFLFWSLRNVIVRYWMLQRQWNSRVN